MKMKYLNCVDCNKEKTTKSQRSSPRCKRCNNILTNLKNNRIKKEYVKKNKHNKETYKCEICQFESSNLVSHLYFKHNLKGSEYKKIYNKEFRGKFTESERKNYKKSSKRCIEYWVNLGFSEEESKNKVSEHQKTFSKEKCIEKYGEEEGMKIFLERQERWQKSLKNKSEEELRLMNANKRFNIKKYKEKYGDDWVDVFLKNRSGRYEKECYSTFKNLEEFIAGITSILTSENAVKRFITKSKFIREIFNITKENEDEIIKKCSIYLPDNVKRTRYGSICYLDDIKYRSCGEYQIALFLKNNNINFEYEKKYIATERFLYDFFLPDYNLYIEYTGMADGKNLHNYETRLEKKKELILKNNFNCFMSNNIELIKKRILDEKENNDRTSL